MDDLGTGVPLFMGTNQHDSSEVIFLLGRDLDTSPAPGSETNDPISILGHLVTNQLSTAIRLSTSGRSENNYTKRLNIANFEKKHFSVLLR